MGGEDPYTVELTEAAVKQLGELQKPDMKRVAKKIDALALDQRPPGSVNWVRLIRRWNLSATSAGGPNMPLSLERICSYHMPGSRISCLAYLACPRCATAAP